MGAVVPAVLTPKPLKVAIVGFASNTRDLAPYKDDSWQIWGLNNLWQYIPRWDVWFEQHDPAQIEPLYGPEYVAFLKAAGKPVYMQKHLDEYPASVEYPKAEMEARVNPDKFWPSSISYMAALAIDMAPVEIGFYGIDLIGDDEYSFQREGLALLIGIAKGRGIKVTIPEGSSLLKTAEGDYGYDPGIWSPGPFETFLVSQIGAYSKKRSEAEASLHTYDGAIQGFQNALVMFKHNARGGALAGAKAAQPATTGEATA